MNNQDIFYNINNMGKIVKDGLRNPIVREKCMHPLNKSYPDIKKIQQEFSRFIGFCILFKSAENVDEYMLIEDEKNQVDFLKRQIEEKIGNLGYEITRKEIIEYAFKNFKKNGYVFHAANSLSAMKKMENGLIDNDVDREEQQELLRIEELYRKYNPNSEYSPIGHGATDITNRNTGWFFDGLPIHSTGYANSPQWFNYFCGKSYVYFQDIPEEERNGYINRDYKKALNAVLWLIKNENMKMEDRKEILVFFKKCWDKYKDTTPCLIFIPVSEVGINEDISLEQYLSNEGEKRLFSDILSGTVNPIKNCCCKKRVLPDKLSLVDLSPILPRVKKEDNSISKENNSMTIDYSDER